MLNQTNIVNIGGLDCYEKDGLAHLNLEQVARGLGFTQTAASGNVVVRWERVRRYLTDFGVPTCGDDGFIPENIFYRLAMKAKNEAAEKFQAWVADEVIPAIRKTGGYIHGAQDMSDMEIMSKAFLIAQRTIEQRDARIKTLESDKAALTAEIASFAPIKTYYEQILSSTGSLTTTQIAADYGLSAQKLNKILHEDGVQHKLTLPTAKAGGFLFQRPPPCAFARAYVVSASVAISRGSGMPYPTMFQDSRRKQAHSFR